MISDATDRELIRQLAKDPRIINMARHADSLDGYYLGSWAFAGECYNVWTANGGNEDIPFGAPAAAVRLILNR